MPATMIRRAAGVISFLVTIAVGVPASHAEAQWYFAGYLGANSTRPADVAIDVPASNLSLTFRDVEFDAHPPTGPAQELLTDTVFIGEDNNSGGGSEAGLDASVTYTLDFTGIEPHPNQGFHVRLDINADGSQGADQKHKTFWVTGCEPPPCDDPH